VSVEDEYRITAASAVLKGHASVHEPDSHTGKCVCIFDLTHKRDKSSCDPHHETYAPQTTIGECRTNISERGFEALFKGGKYRAWEKNR